jgi:hypothetical protein
MNPEPLRILNLVVAEAARTAQREARDADFASDGGDWVDHTDYHVLLVCVGHLKDLKP